MATNLPVPTTPLEKEYAERCERFGIVTDIDRRWEEGVEHHPESVALAKSVATIDWLFADDIFGLKFGGDGDNGETLMYLLDIHFELMDAIVMDAAKQIEAMK